MKTNSDGADVTSAGKLFLMRAAATEKERSPMVERCITGTSSAAVDADRRRCRAGMYDTRAVHRPGKMALCHTSIGKRAQRA